MTSKIVDLPSDEIPPTNEELDVMSWMFKPSSSDKMVSEKPTPQFHFEIKIFFIVLIIYILFHLDWVDQKLKKCIPFFQTNSISFVLIKGIIFVLILYYIFNYHYLKT